MKRIYLVTGNQKKLKEWQAIVPADIELESASIDLPELQSDDPEEIVADKAKRAYEAVGKPVVVEDVSAGLDKYDGLPGPFIKYFVQRLGGDALYKISGEEETAATVSCSVAYYDGTTLLSVRADVHGKVVAPRGDNMFSFDIVFIPDGETQTFSEMDPNKKNSLSHRSKAIKLFIEKFESLQD
jgi:inosine triphosphate pyrophosphatase